MGGVVFEKSPCHHHGVWTPDFGIGPGPGTPGGPEAPKTAPGEPNGSVGSSFGAGATHPQALGRFGRFGFGPGLKMGLIWAKMGTFWTKIIRIIGILPFKVAQNRPKIASGIGLDDLNRVCKVKSFFSDFAAKNREFLDLFSILSISIGFVGTFWSNQPHFATTLGTEKIGKNQIVKNRLKVLAKSSRLPPVSPKSIYGARSYPGTKF